MPRPSTRAADPFAGYTLADWRALERGMDRELAMRPDLPGSLAAFARLAWDTVEPGVGLEWNWHLDILFESLRRQSTGDPEYRKLVICVPPGTMKSLAVSVFRPAWQWLHNPARRRLCLANDDDLVIRDSRRTREIITADWYQEMAAEAARRRGDRPWTLTRDQNEKANFENTARGFRQCRSIGSRITGKRADDVDVDDPIDAKTVVNGTPDQVDTRLREVNNTIDKVLPTRVNVLAEACWTTIMQRLHPDDPAGRAIERGWRLIQFAMEFDPDDANNHPEDPRTEAGELLYRQPSKLFPPEEVAELKARLLTQWAGQGNQKPVAGDALALKEEWLTRRYHEPAESVAQRAIEVWLTIDANKKGKATSDDTSAQVWARCKDGRYLLDRVARPMSYPEFERVVDDLIDRWRSWLATKGGALIEDTANGATYMQIRGPIYKGVTLHTFMPSRDTPGTDKSKAARADYVIKAASALAIVLPDTTIAPWVAQYRERLLGWPAIGRDDMDATSQLHMRWALQEARPSFSPLAALAGGRR